MNRQCLRRESADHFQTNRVSLHPCGDGWDIRPFGDSFSFAELQNRRKSGVIEQYGDAQVFANLGVSLQLLIQHKGRQALALVQQGNVLKLVSGYVPGYQLGSPLQTAWAELMEEVLPVEGDTVFGFSRNNELLADPYNLKRKGALPVSIPPFLGDMSPQSLMFSDQRAGWPVSFYIHQPTASLQLVFPVSITLPDQISLVHTEDEVSPTGEEVLSLFDPQCPVVLMELEESLQPSGKLFTLKSGQWHLWEQNQVQLSEYFSGPGKQLGKHFLQ